MPLVTIDEVRAVIDTDPERDLTTFITTADTFVNQFLSDKGLTGDLLTQIELYLAAHFVALTEEKGSLTGDKLGDASSNLGGSKFGQGLLSTRYGQQAILFDISGTLAGMAEPRKQALFRVL